MALLSMRNQDYNLSGKSRVASFPLGILRGRAGLLSSRWKHPALKSVLGGLCGEAVGCILRLCREVKKSQNGNSDLRSPAAGQFAAY